MLYLLMIYHNEASEAEMLPEEFESRMKAYNTFTTDVRNADRYKGGNPLHPTQTATTVRVRNGQTLTSDGPFAETKEQLGGYYLLDCPNLDDAIHWASKIPSAVDGSIEVRPIMVIANAATA